jgi:hypothetical protein
MKIDVAKRDLVGAFVAGLAVGALAEASGLQIGEVVSVLADSAVSWPCFAAWAILLFRREIGGAIRRLRKFKIGEDSHIEGTFDPLPASTRSGRRSRQDARIPPP